MNSSQWEVVTKSKKHKNLEKKILAREEKKRLDVLPKLNEILSSEEYQNIINAANNGEPSSKSSNSSTRSKSPKNKTKTKETLAKKITKQKVAPKKQVKAKGLEAALHEITREEFSEHLKELKNLYAGSELLWLKGIANYLNMRLAFDCDPIFSGKSIHYPSNLAPAGLRKEITDFLTSVGKINVEYFYHTLLVSMTNELLKNQPIVGYKLLLQLLAQNWPDICSENMAKTALLRNSYVNRSPVCLTILWAVGQGGFKKLSEGLKVWMNLMIPNIEMRSYTKFVTEHVKNIINYSEDQQLKIDQPLFFEIYAALMRDYNIARDHQECLKECAGMLLQKYISQSSKHANIFLTLLRTLKDRIRDRNELNGCISCLVYGPEESYKVWKMNYKKQFMPSILLLEKIGEESNGAASELIASEGFQKFLKSAHDVNEEWIRNSKRTEFLQPLADIVKDCKCIVQPDWGVNNRRSKEEKVMLVFAYGEGEGNEMTCKMYNTEAKSGRVFLAVNV